MKRRHRLKSYTSYTFFTIFALLKNNNIYINKIIIIIYIYIYISIYAKKCNKCNAYYLSSIQGCNVSVRHCKMCKDLVIINNSIKKLPQKSFFTGVLVKILWEIIFYYLKRSINIIFFRFVHFNKI